MSEVSFSRASIAELLAAYDWDGASVLTDQISSELPNLAASVAVTADDVLVRWDNLESLTAHVANYRKAKAAFVRAESALETKAGKTIANAVTEMTDERTSNRTKVMARLTSISVEAGQFLKYAKVSDAERAAVVTLIAAIADVCKAAKPATSGTATRASIQRAALKRNGHEVADKARIPADLVIIAEELLAAGK